MWPWEHVAFAYVLYSLARRVATGEAPRGDAVLVVALASLLPDLVDKPLSWTFGLFPSGYSVAHSALVAPLVSLAVLALAARRGRPRLGAAFGVGYGSHLVGDVLHPLVLGDPVVPEKLLWPLVTLPPYETRYSLAERVAVYAFRYAHQLLDLRFGPLLIFELSLVLGVLGLWLYDGAPGVRGLVRFVSPS